MYKQAFAGRPGFGPQGQHGFGGCGGRGRFGQRPEGGRRGIPPWARFFEGGWASAPVNIEDAGGNYVLTLYAAGLNKNNISLSVQNDVLTIAYQGTAAPAEGEGQPEEAGKFTRREFRDPSFERTFALGGKVAVADISANYAEGVLTVTLPKTPEASQPVQAIPVQ